MSIRNYPPLVRFGIPGIIIVAAVAAYFTFGTAPSKVTGSTPEEQVDSVNRIIAGGSSKAPSVLAQAAVNNPYPQVREAAILGMSQSLRPEVRPVIETALNDPSPQVRSAAAKVLGAFNDEPAVEKLAEVCAKDPEPAVRIGAVTGLGRNNDTRAIIALREIIESNTNRETQHRAIKEIYKKTDVTYVGDDPVEVKDWKKYALYQSEKVKQFPAVKAAYAKAGIPLPRYPTRVTNWKPLIPGEESKSLLEE